MAFGFAGLLTGGTPPDDVQMPDGLPVSGGQGSPLVDAYIALNAQRIKNAITAPRDAYTGDLQVMGPDGHPTAEAMDRANGMAGLAMTGSLPFSAPQGAIRMFGGRNAATADHAALEQAQGLAGSGADRKAILDQTGWFQGPDQQWRFEIPDNTAFMKGAGNASQVADARTRVLGRTSDQATVGDVAHHPLAFSAYPDTASLGFSGKNLGSGARGEYSPGGFYSDEINPGITLNNQLQGNDRMSTLLHEMQHDVQGLEGFAKGGNPAAYKQQDWEKSILDAAANRKWQAVDAYPEAAQAFRELNQHKNDLLWKHGENWGGKASDAEMARLDELEAALSAKPGGQQISDADWAHQSAIAQVGAPDAKTKFADWAMDQYRRQAGEVEARNVQTRRDFTPEQRRATPPWETQDVPDAQQIVRFADGRTLPFSFARKAAP